jgi:hypothetical protein
VKPITLLLLLSLIDAAADLIWTLFGGFLSPDPLIEEEFIQFRFVRLIAQLLWKNEIRVGFRFCSRFAAILNVINHITLRFHLISKVLMNWAIWIVAAHQAQIRILDH